jgi:hypothetical protein
MQIKLRNKVNRYLEKWLELPATDITIQETLIELGALDEEELEVTDLTDCFDIAYDPELTLIDFNDIAIQLNS